MSKERLRKKLLDGKYPVILSEATQTLRYSYIPEKAFYINENISKVIDLAAAEKVTEQIAHTNNLNNSYIQDKHCLKHKLKQLTPFQSGESQLKTIGDALKATKLGIAPIKKLTGSPELKVVLQDGKKRAKKRKRDTGRFLYQRYLVRKPTFRSRKQKQTKLVKRLHLNVNIGGNCAVLPEALNAYAEAVASFVAILEANNVKVSIDVFETAMLTYNGNACEKHMNKVKVKNLDHRLTTKRLAFILGNAAFFRGVLFSMMARSPAQVDEGLGYPMSWAVFERSINYPQMQRALNPENCSSITIYAQRAAIQNTNDAKKELIDRLVEAVNKNQLMYRHEHAYLVLKPH
jgi:hypothetical protein